MKTILSKFIGLAVALCLIHGSFAQTTLVGWNFFSSGVSSSGIPANSGTVISTTGTGSSPFFSGVGCGFQEAICNDFGLNDTWVSTSFSTTGYTSVTYSFQHGSFTGGPTGFKFQYSLNGSTWVDVVGPYTSTVSGGCGFYSASDVAMPAAVDNQPNVYVRWLCTTGGGTGGNRLAEVSIKGTAGCTEPDVPSISGTNSICAGSNTTLNISGNLNDATQWHIYTGSCGGTQIGTTASSTFLVSPSSTTTYFIRGEGGCSTPGSCGTMTVTVNASDDASFNYSAASYCVNDTDPTPTITGLAGGTFSSTAGLSINASTGQVDVSASTPGTYTVTYTTSGTCPNSSNVTVTVNALDDPSFSYSAAAYCSADTDPTPTITGLAGGAFSSTAGLSINASTGQIDLSASTPGTYTVTYTTAGTCPNTSNVSVTVNASDDASFNYSAASYCVNDTDPTPTITGLAGGTFSSTAGLSINASTGQVDVSVSTPGTYTVTYTTSGTCPNSSNVTVTVNALDDPSFSYSAAAYCSSDTDPTPTITGLAGGAFSSTAGLSINASTGQIDLSASTPATYTVTYTTAGTCPNTSNVSVTVNASDDASFNYSAAAYCVDDSDPTPTITGLAGGTFSSTAGLSINASTGQVDVSVSTPGTYTVTYTTSGTCPNSSAVSITVSVCAGSECTNAIDLAPMNACGDTQTVTGSTIGGTTSTETSFCGTSSASGGANWYTFTGDGGEWTVSSLNAGTDYDTKIWVYEGTCGALNCIDGNDDFNSTAQSQVTFLTTSGLTYYVVIGGFSSNEGDYELTFTNVETEAPVADVTTLADVTGVCEVTSLTDPTATDNCSAVTVTHDATLPITTNSTITWTYTDASGNSSTQSQDVVLTDAVAPTASNPDTMYYECVSDAVIDAAVVTDAMDNCSGTVIVTHVSDAISGDGCMDTISRVYNVADQSGNSIDVTQIIILHDVTPPTASNPFSLTVQCIDDVPLPNPGMVTGEADNCSTPTVAFVSDVSDGLSCPETITRTYSVTDNCGNSITVTQTITVNDISAPAADIANLPTEVAFCDVTLTAPTATDNCSGVVTATTTQVFPINALGTTTVTWTYVDDCGNTSSQTQDVTIESIDVSTYIANDGITIVSSNVAPGVTYQWIDCSAGNTPLVGETNHNYTPTYSSDFAVIITEDGCSDTSACVTVTEVGIDELNTIEVVLFPNPTNGVFNIKVDANIAAMEVVDVLGRNVTVPMSLVDAKVDATFLAPGKYIIRILTDNDELLVKEFVVMD